MKPSTAPLLEESNNRYTEQSIMNEETLLEINRVKIDEENVYADNPPIIVNKADNMETSIEVGLGEIGTLKSFDACCDAPKEMMQFNVSVLGRHKVTSKEYKKGMKSQKN